MSYHLHRGIMLVSGSLFDSCHPGLWRMWTWPAVPDTVPGGIWAAVPDTASGDIHWQPRPARSSRWQPEAAAAFQKETKGAPKPPKGSQRDQKYVSTSRSTTQAAFMYIDTNVICAIIVSFCYDFRAHIDRQTNPSLRENNPTLDLSIFSHQCPEREVLWP